MLSELCDGIQLMLNHQMGLGEMLVSLLEGEGMDIVLAMVHTMEGSLQHYREKLGALLAYSSFQPSIP